MGSRPWRALAVLLVVIIQFAVPLAALAMPDKPHRLGWQMYSGLQPGDIVVTDREGTPVDVPWSDVLGRSPRVELDWTQRLPQHLCSHFDEPTLTVTVGARSRSATC